MLFDNVEVSPQGLFVQTDRWFYVIEGSTYRAIRHGMLHTHVRSMDLKASESLYLRILRK